MNLAAFYAHLQDIRKYYDLSVTQIVPRMSRMNHGCWFIGPGLDRSPRDKIGMAPTRYARILLQGIPPDEVIECMSYSNHLIFTTKPAAEQAAKNLLMHIAMIER